MVDVRAGLTGAGEHPWGVDRFRAQLLENPEGLRREWHAVRQAVLAALGGNRPPTARQIHLGPRSAE